MNRISKITMFICQEHVAKLVWVQNTARGLFKNRPGKIDSCSRPGRPSRPQILFFLTKYDNILPNMNKHSQQLAKIQFLESEHVQQIPKNTFSKTKKNNVPKDCYRLIKMRGVPVFPGSLVNQNDWCSSISRFTG